MTKRSTLLSLSAAFGAALAVTTGYALANAPKAATASARAVVSTSAPAVSSTVSLASKSDGKEKDDGKDAPDPASAKVTPAEATAAALTAHPGGKITDTPELENEDGVAVYGVDIMATDGKKYDVKVDASTGKVLKSEADDNDAEQNDGPNDRPDGK